MGLNDEMDDEIFLKMSFFWGFGDDDMIIDCNSYIFCKDEIGDWIE